MLGDRPCANHNRREGAQCNLAPLAGVSGQSVSAAEVEAERDEESLIWVRDLAHETVLAAAWKGNACSSSVAIKYGSNRSTLEPGRDWKQ